MALILVTGSRYWKNGRSIFNRLAEESADTTIIEGGCEGADRLSNYAGRLLGFKVITVKAEWHKYGNSAGPRRNREMLNMKPDKVIAFHEDLSSSRGTKDCVHEALSRGIPVEIINV